MRPRLNNSNGICVPHGPEHLLGTEDGLTMRQLLPGSPHGFLAVLCGPGTGQGAQRGGRALMSATSPPRVGSCRLL